MSPCSNWSSCPTSVGDRLAPRSRGCGCLDWLHSAKRPRSPSHRSCRYLCPPSLPVRCDPCLRSHRKTSRRAESP
jgi:hypothetical protein